MRPLRIALVGPENVGKTSLILKLTNPSMDVLRHESPTIRVACVEGRVRLPSGEVFVELWDTVGQERFDSLPPAFYHSKDVLMLVFDVTDSATLSALRLYADAARAAIPLDSETLYWVVGNKTDCEDARVVDREGWDLAQAMGSGYTEVTATDYNAVHAMFVEILGRACASAKSVGERRRALTAEAPDVPCC